MNDLLRDGATLERIEKDLNCHRAIYGQDGYFINQALKGKNITIYGDGKQTRSFCYIDDLISGIIKLMQTKLNTPVNLGNPVEFNMIELAEIILRLTGSKSKICFHDLPTDDPKQRKPDISLARKILNWEPKIKLEEGLKNTISYFKNPN